MHENKNQHFMLEIDLTLPKLHMLLTSPEPGSAALDTTHVGTTLLICC